MTQPPIHRTLPTINVLGTPLCAVNPAIVLHAVDEWLQGSQFGRYVCVTGVHGVMEGTRSVEVRRAHCRAAACVPDGMPMVWLGRYHGHKDTDRVYGPDLMLSVLELAARKGFTNYFYGGRDGVAEDLKARMERRFPGLRVVGTACPPFRPMTQEEQARAISEINAASPDLLWIGIGTPKQELLMASLSPVVRAKVMIGVGAAFDFHTGRVRQAPRWIQRCGGEWFFRMCMEPRRLAGRYLRNNPEFLFRLLLQLTGLSRCEILEDP